MTHNKPFALSSPWIRQGSVRRSANFSTISRVAALCVITLTVVILVSSRGAVSADPERVHWTDPYDKEWFPSKIGSSRLVLLAEVGVQLPNDQVGGAIRLHHYALRDSGPKAHWKARLMEFDGLLFKRDARVAVISGRAIVHIKHADRYFAAEISTGKVQEIGPTDESVLTANKEKAWMLRQIREPVEPEGESQSADIDSSR